MTFRAGVVEDLADEIPLVRRLIGQLAAEDERYLVPASAEAMADALQHAQSPNVEQIDAGFFVQWRRTADSAVSPNSMPPPNGRLRYDCDRSVDAR